MNFKEIHKNQTVQITFYILIIIISTTYVYYFQRTWMVYYMILLTTATIGTFLIHFFKKTF